MKDFLSFSKIRDELLKCRMNSPDDYFETLYKHPDWPENPEVYYVDKWKGWDHFLLVEAERNFISFKNLLFEAKKNQVKTMEDYRKLCKKPNHCPFDPEKVYQEWPGEDVFLELIQKIELPYISPLLQKIPWSERRGNLKSATA